MVGSYTENLEKPRTVKIGGWAVARVWALARDNTVYTTKGGELFKDGLFCMNWWEITAHIHSWRFMFDFYYI